MEVEGPDTTTAGFPELTELGKRIEVLRIERGVSKQHLARFAGTSRQQLWRVMTGKSDLTGSLRQRLADALHVDAAALSSARSTTTGRALPTALLTPIGVNGTVHLSAGAVEFDDWIADAGRIEHALRVLPAGEAGSRAKRALLNALEDIAVERGRALPAPFFELRRRVLAGEL